jgi:hypothetical protein
MRLAFKVNAPLYLSELNVTFDEALKRNRGIFFDDLDSILKILNEQVSVQN